MPFPLFVPMFVFSLFCLWIQIQATVDKESRLNKTLLTFFIALPLSFIIWMALSYHYLSYSITTIPLSELKTDNETIVQGIYCKGQFYNLNEKLKTSLPHNALVDVKFANNSLGINWLIDPSFSTRTPPGF